MKHKKIFKIILINILIGVVLICISEYFTFQSIQSSENERAGKSTIVTANLPPEYFHGLGYGVVKKFNFENDKKKFRKTIYGSTTKRPLLFFLCSFTYGYGLKENQNLPYKVAKITGRTVYNRSYPAWGAQYLLYQFKRDDLKKEVPDAEYIIYTYIFEHVKRLSMYNTCDYSFEPMLRYKVINGELVEIKPGFLPFYSLFTVRYIQNAIVRENLKNLNDEFDLFKQIVRESKRLSDLKYPNSKFVIMTYKQAPHPFMNSALQDATINDLKKEGFIIVDAEELVGHSLRGHEYLLEDSFHPSEKAWDEIAPKLVENLKM